MQFPIHQVEATSAIGRARRFVDSLTKVHLSRSKCNGREKKGNVIFAKKEFDKCRTTANIVQRGQNKSVGLDLTDVKISSLFTRHL